ncbi:HipA domain protein [Asticcacaulis excentricus CB 48]|uniref:HipA domain protein n=2 Tax=Asticcacaulis excentricus TaxID=78587 RepID=E8RMX1_ASTEC|nr:HipA domain protein [Asticcacaulis excentricus CB 48]
MARDVKNIEWVEVSLDFNRKPRLIGHLAWKRSERRSYFEFAGDFLSNSLPLSPFKLAASPGAVAAGHAPFEGLHGLFNDSLPDEWGRKLLDRRLQRLGYDHQTLSPLDRLCYVGDRGMGALIYKPQGQLDALEETTLDLDWLADQADLVQQEAPEADIDRLQANQGGSGGVRPKVVVGFNPETGLLVTDNGAGADPAYIPHIVKFKADADPDEIGPEEYAYSLMARAAGVIMPETRLIRGHRGLGYFAAERFDRNLSGRHHVLTLSGLLDADHRVPSVTYGDLLKVTRLLTRDERDVNQMFRRMAFNVLAHNRDDHAKNHAFRMDPDGSWHPTPAYDITYSSGPGGEHNLTIAGEGRSPGLGHLFDEAKASSIKRLNAEEAVEAVRAAIAQWPEFAAQAGLSDRRTAELDHVLNGRGAPHQASQHG